MAHTVWGLGFEVWGLGCRVSCWTKLQNINFEDPRPLLVVYTRKFAKSQKSWTVDGFLRWAVLSSAPVARSAGLELCAIQVTVAFLRLSSL